MLQHPASHQEFVSFLFQHGTGPMLGMDHPNSFSPDTDTWALGVGPYQVPI